MEMSVKFPESEPLDLPGLHVLVRHGRKNRKLSGNLLPIIPWRYNRKIDKQIETNVNSDSVCHMYVS